VTASLFDLIKRNPKGIYTEEICLNLNLRPQDLGDSFEELLDDEKIVSFAGFWLTPEAYEAVADEFIGRLISLHEENPATIWVDPRVLQGDWKDKSYARILSSLAENEAIFNTEKGIRAMDFVLVLGAKQQALLERIEAEIQKYPVNVPYPSDIANGLGIPIQAFDEIIQLGIFANRIHLFGENIYYTTTQLEAFVTMIPKQDFTNSEAKEALGTTRKYLIPILLYLDKIGVTERDGDIRRRL
jgi:selenocysteine-specific elongation factor